MDTSWWLALAAVVAIALVAAVVDGRARSRSRPGGERRPPGRPRGRIGTGGPREARPAGRWRATGGRKPQPAEIWWADVPYEDGPGSKDRPCLVLEMRGKNAVVVKITSKYHDERAGVIPLPPGAVGDAQGRPSFLETDELRSVPVWAFRRRVGVVDPILWDQVRHLHS